MNDELQVQVEIRRGLEQPWTFRMALGPVQDFGVMPPEYARRHFERAFQDVMHAALDKLFGREPIAP